MNGEDRLQDRYPPALLEEIFRAHDLDPPFPAARDREDWARIGEHLGPERDRLVAEAEAAAREPVPPFPATLYLDFKRTGERRAGQRPVDQRRGRLRTLTLAECLEGRGRFLDPLLDLIWAICEESSWCRPAHQPELADIAHPGVDLMAAMTAFDLAEADALLGTELDPAVRARIRYEANHRCFAPYLARDDFHWMFSTPSHEVNNWASVCSGGILAAAVYLESDPARLTALAGKAMRSLDDYLAGFDVDGGTSEGSFCWAYGFGYFTMVAHLLERRSGGRVDLWNARTRRIANFPLATQIAPRRFVNFSDCEIGFTHISAQLAYLARRLDLPDLARIAAHQPPNVREGQLPWGLRSLFWQPPRDLEPFVPAAHDWFAGLQWMIARQAPADPDAIVLAAKGGHNDEMHNQNDVGHFTVDAWSEPLLVDLGKGVFNRRYFDSRGGRYDFLVNASTGHSVPVVNGCAQAHGAQHGAVLRAHEHGEAEDRLELDITATYPAEPGLASLHRLIRLDRGRSSVEVRDEVRFAAAPGLFESVLITLRPVDIAAGTATIRGKRGGLEVAVDPSGIEIKVEEIPDLELEDRSVTVRRVRFCIPEPVLEGRIRLRITPVPS